MKFFSKKNPFVIAEIASSHGGNPVRLNKIINDSLKTKADGIKLQIFSTDSLVSKNNKLYKNLKKIEIKYNMIKEVLKNFKKHKKKFIVEPFDIESLIFAESINFFQAIKVPSACLEESKYIKLLKKIKKPIILGIGGTDLLSIKKAYDKLNQNNREIVLMLGFQNFPTKVNDAQLNKIKFLKKNFNCLIGFADHTDSNEYFLSKHIPILAHHFGANIIEKHITINRKRKGPDHYSAFDCNEFKEFVEIIKSTSKWLGKKKWMLNYAEKKYATFAKKYAVAKKLIYKGSFIKTEDVAFKRTNLPGLSPRKINLILGKKAKRNLKPDQIIKVSDTTK